MHAATCSVLEIPCNAFGLVPIVMRSFGVQYCDMVATQPPLRSARKDGPHAGVAELWAAG